MGNTAEKIGGGLFNTLFGKTEQPDIPEPEIPAVPAPSRKTDTGASVAVGSDAAKDVRASGRGTSTSTTSTIDVLGGLGKGGLSI